MEIRREESLWIVRMDKGDNVREQIADFASEQGIRGARISAVGAVSSAVLAFFNEESKQYDDKSFNENLEVLAMNGSISRLEDDEPMVHIHTILGRSDFSVIGGHLKEATVSVTLEAFVIPTEDLSRGEAFGPFKLWQL